MRPTLSGYVRFETRPTADEILAGGWTDPLLVRWQYGLGRAAVFSSDAKSRWAANWLDVAGLRSPVDEHLPRSAAARERERSGGPLRRRESGTGGRLPSFGARARKPAMPPDLYVIGPGRFPESAGCGAAFAGDVSRAFADRFARRIIPRAAVE